jgi:hypothetical protein
MLSAQPQKEGRPLKIPHLRRREALYKMEPGRTKGVEGSDLATTPEPVDQCPETAHLVEEHTKLSREILSSLVVSHMLVRPDSAHRAVLIQLPYRPSVS